MIDRNESQLIAREQRNQRAERSRPTQPERWQGTAAANDPQQRPPFRTLVVNRATRYRTAD